MQKRPLPSERERETRTSRKQPPAPPATAKKDQPAKRFGGFGAALRTPEQPKAGLRLADPDPREARPDIFTQETSKKLREDAFDKLSDKLIEFKLQDQQKHRKRHDQRKRRLQFDDAPDAELDALLADPPRVFTNTDPQEASHLPERPSGLADSSKKDSAQDAIQRSIEFSQHREWLFGKSPQPLRFEPQEDSIVVGSELFGDGLQLRAEKPLAAPRPGSHVKKRNSVDALNLGPQGPADQSAEDSINFQSVVDERDVYNARMSQNSSRS